MKGDCNLAASLIKTVESSVNGVLTIQETKRDVFCEIMSDIRSVKSEAGAYGINAEIKIKISDVNEYEGEKLVEFDGNRYEITKIFRIGDMLELTCVRGIR